MASSLTRHTSTRSAMTSWPPTSYAKPSLAFVGAAIFFCGCSKTPEKLYPVNGTVSVAGKPMHGGTVQFEMIEKGNSGSIYTSSGTIDEEGRYELSTWGKSGAPAGEHRVWVNPNLLRMPDRIGVSAQRMSPVPQKYRLLTTTDLSYTVAPEDNTIDIDVPVN